MGSRHADPGYQGSVGRDGRRSAPVALPATACSVRSRHARPRSPLGMWGRPAACKADWFVGPSGGVGSPSSLGGEKAAEEPLTASIGA